MRCPSWQPISFFFSQPTNFLSTFHFIFFQTCRYYHFFTIYSGKKSRERREQEKTGGGRFEQQLEIPRRFAFAFLAFRRTISPNGSRGKGPLLFIFLAATHTSKTESIYTYSHTACFPFCFLSLVLPPSCSFPHSLGLESLLQRILYLLLSF
ncbi:hypothetical protein QBC41DRAFT_107245 [Cercophora samala]|uniref:Uncharacterized protein n=1 Tax=Cercophora samala TaxID=330535 RepID=A0AA39ZEF4_9PEZI|nr:hypothetical protein QBC41DRAFT_107245 [Cercophora samala]